MESLSQSMPAALSIPGMSLQSAFAPTAPNPPSGTSAVPNSNSIVPNNPPSNPPTPIKPTSRGRIYRIPNTSDNTTINPTGTIGNSGNNGTIGSGMNSNSGTPDALWATREIAALDFLMNVPLRAEREIVRAGLSGERWHRHQHQHHAHHHRHPHPSTNASSYGANKDASDAISGLSGAVGMSRASTMEGDDETKDHLLRTTSSILGLSKNSGIEDEEGKMSEAASTAASTIPSMVLGHSSKNQVGAIGGGVGMRWWEKLILKDKRFFSAANQQVQRQERIEMEERELERPDSTPLGEMSTHNVVSGAIGGDGVAFSAGDAGKGMDSTATGGYYAHNKGLIASAPTTPGGGGGVPGRRLDGRDAVTIKIPDEFRSRPTKPVARQAAVREWEMKVAWHGGDTDNATQYPQKHSNHHHRHHHHHHRHHHHHHNHQFDDKNSPNESSRQAMLDGRIFFSTKKSYPVAVFSTIKYEPQKEEAARRRKKIEELGGGGTQFVLPERDWRGISYRALLPQEQEVKQNKAFNRLLSSDGLTKTKKEKKLKQSSPRIQDTTSESSSASSSSEDENDNTSVSSSESGTYVPGFLDDPQMVQGRHRHVMVGDKVTGPIVSSTIQFVKPSVLKADLNKQFRERFDKWEPPKSQRKFIGAKVIDGVYTLIDPTETIHEDVDDVDGIRRKRSGSITSDRENIKMPPSLTLSKIRTLKQQALVACVRSKIEISTLALACIYFERLCLDCRVDKSNRRLSFAACLLLAAKVNESNSMIAYDRGVETKQSNALNSWVKPNKKSGKIFESLIEFFANEWSLSLKQLYSAEWIVFTALGFSLSATPSQVAFHFKRLLKVLEWNPRSYLGSEMYGQWQESLMEESLRKERRKARRDRRIKRNERKLLKLQRELHLQQAEVAHRRSSASGSDEFGRSSSSFRRHSVSSILLCDSTEGSVRAPGTPHHEEHFDNPDRSLRNSWKSESSQAIKGIGLLNRFSKSKQPSVGKDMDKLNKPQKPIKLSVSSPNLTALAVAKSSDMSKEFKLIHEGDSENDHTYHSDRDARTKKV